MSMFSEYVSSKTLPAVVRAGHALVDYGVRTAVGLGAAFRTVHITSPLLAAPAVQPEGKPECTAADIQKAIAANKASEAEIWGDVSLLGTTHVSPKDSASAHARACEISPGQYASLRNHM